MVREFAFVISAVGDPGSEVRRRADTVSDFIVTPVAGEFSLEVQRADRDPTPGQITAQVVRCITSAAVVVADLSGRNPNVFYEVALAHAFNRPTVLLVNDARELPFDTQNERTIVIGDASGDISMPQGDEAKKALREAFKVVLKEAYTPRSLVTAAVGQASLAGLAPSDPVAAELSVVKDTVSETLALVRRIARRSIPPLGYRPHDLEQLKGLVQQWVINGSVDLPSLHGAMDESTSGAFDRWLTETAEGAREALQDIDPEDIPF